MPLLRSQLVALAGADVAVGAIIAQSPDPNQLANRVVLKEVLRSVAQLESGTDIAVHRAEGVIL